MFVCIKGTLTDGHLYAGRAAERGAAAVVCSEEIDVPAQVTVIKVEDTKKALALMAASCGETQKVVNKKPLPKAFGEP